MISVLTPGPGTSSHDPKCSFLPIGQCRKAFYHLTQKSLTQNWPHHSSTDISNICYLSPTCLYLHEVSELLYLKQNRKLCTWNYFERCHCITWDVCILNNLSTHRKYLSALLEIKGDMWVLVFVSLLKKGHKACWINWGWCWFNFKTPKWELWGESPHGYYY